MANGFIDGVGYPMNGGLAAGFTYGQKIAEEQRRRGLASGFTQYMNAQDDAGKRAARSQIAQYDPNTAFNLMKYEQELANKDKMTPYQQSTLDIQRQQLANQGKMNEYQTWQKEEVLRKEQEAKEKEKLLGDALYRYQTAQTDEDKNVALADVYRVSPDFAKDILKKQKEKESDLNGGYRQYLVEQAFNPNVPEEQRKIYLGMAQSLAQDPMQKGAGSYETTKAKQYAEAGLPYGNGTLTQNTPQSTNVGEEQVPQAQGMPTAASLAQAKKRAEEAIELEFSPQKKTAEAEAKKYAEDLDAVRTAEANYPQLESNVKRLRELSTEATFTQAGRARDLVAKELFGVTTEGAKARAELESIVNNAVLPLLKQTFGAAFTAEEGLRLQKTLANPDATDKEKIAELDTFIKQKKADIETKRRKIKLYEKKSGSLPQEENVISAEEWFNQGRK